MRYTSTRGKSQQRNFSEVLLAGLADDGGLYLPTAWPQITPELFTQFRDQSYVDIACAVMTPFIGESIPENDFHSLVHDAYAVFDDPMVVPLRALEENQWIGELFHGPTLAFKDVALQLVGRLFDYELEKQSQKVTIVGATSGDTGSAAIEACRDRENIDIYILHPKDRVSEVQRRQMTTVHAPNVFNIALEGTFDDCQNLVKAMFADHAFRDEIRLSAVNSINWARVMAQVVYYVSLASRVTSPGEKISFSVPTGNFGNVFAGYVAKQLGLPIEQFIVGSNKNDILTRFFTTGEMQTEPVVATLSPSMDIQVSSNLERLLYEVSGQNGAWVTTFMQQFMQTGHVVLPEEYRQKLLGLWSGARVDDKETTETIQYVYEHNGLLIDPHTAVGYAAAQKVRNTTGIPLVILSTAHPAKFPDAVQKATGVYPELPSYLSDLFNRKESYTVLPNDFAIVKQFIQSQKK